MLRHGRRTAQNTAMSRTPGATLTQAAAVRSADVMRGWFSASVSATTTTGATTASSRPMAIGPRSSRNASHHQAPAVVVPLSGRPGRRTRSRTTTATASSTVTSRDHTAAYADPPAVPPRAATSMGTTAPAGYTQSPDSTGH